MKVGEDKGHGRLLLAISAVVLIKSQGLRSSCSVFSRGTSAELTCTYSEDIAAIKRDFNVHHYETDINDVIPDTVLGCSWLMDGLRCNSEPGYSVQDYVSHQVVVEISEVRKKHEGRYSCPVVPTSIDDHIGFCTLQYNEALSSPNPVSLLDTAVPDEENPDGVDRAPASFTDMVFTVLPIYVLSAAFIILVILVIFVSLHLGILPRRQMRGRSQGSRSPGSTSPDTNIDEGSNDAENETDPLDPTGAVEPT